MAKYSLDTLTSIFLPKNIRKRRDNYPESRVTLVPHADAISLYHVVKDIIEYLNITPGSGTTDLTATHAASSVIIESSSGDDATINAATTTLAGVMTASDKTNLNSLVTLSGVSAASTDLGTFTGTTIADSSTIKQALQALETSLEAGGSYTDENAQDAIGGILLDSATIDFTYVDGTPSISAAVKDASITYSKIANVNAERLLGRYSNSIGVVQEVSLGAGLAFSGSTLTHSDTSSVANSTNSGATVLQSISFDTFGHVQTVTTKTITAADIGSIDGSGGANRVAYWVDGDTLTSDADFTFNGSGLAINTTLAASHTLTVGGATKTATLTVEGVGALGGSLAAAEIRLNNTTALTGQTWYLNSANAGNLYIATNSLNPELTLDTNGDVLVENRLSLGDSLTGTATRVIGITADGYLREITMGSNMILSSNQLSSSGGGGGGGGYDEIQKDTTPFTPYSILNFVGVAFDVSDNAINSSTDVELHSNLETIADISGLSSGDFIYYNSSAFQKLTPVKDTQDISSGTTVTLPSSPAANTIVDVYRNGILQEENEDYTIAGTLLTFTNPFVTGEKVTTKYFT